MSVLSRHIARFQEHLFTKRVAIVIGTGIIVYYSVKLIARYRYKQKVKSYPKDVVILHQPPRDYRVPSLSPFCLKLETWLRMNDIKYQNEHGFTFGPKGKVPFITYNGEDIGDSQLIIEYLSNKLNKGLNNGFSPKDLGAARAFFKMTEESTFWALQLARLVYESDPKYSGMNPIFAMIVKRVYIKKTHVQGYGRHTKEELFHIGIDDLKALNDFLEDKKYLLGDRPCNEDASLFGIFAQFIYAYNGTLNKYILSDCPRIVAYVENIKNTYWLDWDQSITLNNKR